MSVASTLPAPVVQMALVEKLVEAEQNQPLVQQQVAQEIARQALEEQNRRVHESEASNKGRKVDGKNADQRRREREQARRQKALADGDGDGDGAEADEERALGKPWSGHLLNITI